jgi:hypothetical protein
MRGVRTFKLYPDPRRKRYYKVFVFDTRAMMHAFWRAQVRANTELVLGRRVSAALKRRHTGDLGWAAQAARWYGHWGVIPREHVGQVLFYKRFLGAGVVAHEMTHAALYDVAAHARGGGYRLTARDDERLASVAGELSRQFWCRWYRRPAFRRVASRARVHRG